MAEWISIKIKKPDHKQMVITYNGFKLWPATFDEVEEGFFDVEEEWRKIHYVTHWISFPEPPCP